MKMINATIDGIAISVKEGTTILQAAREMGIKIPTLCYLKDINAIGACRVCMVEVKGARNLVASCVTPVTEGMQIKTATKKVLESRKMTIELLLSDHDKKCLSCARNLNCELQTLSNELGADISRYTGEKNTRVNDTSSPSILRDNNKCILCRRCVAACKQIQSVSVIGANSRGFDTHIGCAFEANIASSPCVNCGQCINVCPTGALREAEEIDHVFNALNDPSKHVIVAPAPAVRVGLGEEFGYPIGTNVEGKMITAMRMLGFDDVFDINFTADLTIIEEGYEFINRLKNGGVLPMITSCSPGWIKFIEHYYPHRLAHLSSCKSPQQMFGAIAKTYYAQKKGLDPKNIVMVTVMPCTAKKFEKGRADQSGAGDGIPDIDYVLTTREFARMVKQAGLMFTNLPDGKYDAPLGIYSGAGLIFGSTGGVMEAALRTVVEVLENKPLEKLEFESVRGAINGIKEAAYKVAGQEVKVAVASGLASARKIMDMIDKGEADYHFIEIMACPGGCVNGGGQPIVPADIRNNVNVPALRASAIYKTDKGMQMRKSHENPAIKELYETFLGEPNGHKAHSLLHTKYVKRGI
ncbi:MAG: NADH-dependent [FeFe] hydrogenase, group A6 [Christensenellales bacterium]